MHPLNPGDDRLRNVTARLTAVRSLPNEARLRVDRELELVCRYGHSPEFLRAFDLATFLHADGYPFDVVTGAWTGSALGWLLGITHVDPFRFGLHFERLLNPEWSHALAPAAFAIPADAVPVVMKWLAERDGTSHLSEARLLQREPPPLHAPARLTKDELEDAARALGVSPPVSLQVLYRTLRAAGASRPLEPTSAMTFRRLTEAARDGFLTLQSDGFQEHLASVAPEHFDHLLAAEALYRPSAIESGLTARYRARRHALEAPTPPHPLMKPFVEDTYGLVLYQEQIVSSAAGIAGFSLERADLLRRKLALRGPSPLAPFRDNFVAAARRNGVDSESAHAVFAALAGAAPYAVSKGGFAQLTQRLAVVFETSVRFPREWSAACAEVGLDG